MESISNFIWAGSELGYLKSVDPCKNIVKNYGEWNEEGRLHAPTALTWSDAREEGVLCGTKNGRIRTFMTDTETFSKSSRECGESPIVGIAVHNESTLACNAKGSVSIWEGDCLMLQKEIGDNICTIKHNKKQSNYVAFGGKENNLKLFDIEHMEKPVFIAKNVRNDSLDLRQSVWVTAVDFIDGEDCKIIVGTGHHKVQIYDTRKQRRPVDEIVWEENPITSISLAANGNDLIVGNTIGSMASIDIRKKQKNGSFKGIKGSISSIKCHQTQGFVACAGLDRFLRIYDIGTRSLLQDFYLKSRLSCVLLSDNSYEDGIFGNNMSYTSSSIKRSEFKKTASDEVDDSIWNEMELVTDEVVQKTRKKKIPEEVGRKKSKKIKVSND